MKTVILGAGSMGCIFGGYLAKAGYDVTLIARRRSHVDAIRKNGLLITSLGGAQVVKVKATDDPKEVKDAELLILITKTVDSITALDSVSHLYKVVKCAVSLQNGLLKDENLKKRFGPKKVIGGTSMIAAAMVGDGHVEYTGDVINSKYGAVTFFGELDGSRTERVESIARMFNNAGLKAEVVDDICSVEWTKLIVAASGHGMSALTRLELWKIMKNRHLASLYVQMMKEAAGVAKRDGARIAHVVGMETLTDVIEADFDRAVELLIEAGNKLEKLGQKHMQASMLQSIMQGKKTEVDETIGYVVNKAKELSVKTPALELCYKVVKGIDDYLGLH
jgi:2-dehydropantoate 2-reductase